MIPSASSEASGPARATAGAPGLVRVTRGGLVESVHRVHVVVAHAEGGVRASAGDPELTTFFRSAAKPFQALPLVEDGAADALGLGGEELAVCCASHNGEERHVALARGILEKAGLDEGALELGARPPRREEDARRMLAEGRTPSRVHNNCSGKHAGMLALAVYHRWPTRGYLLPGHPVQRRMLAEIARWTGLDAGEIGTATDGCGVVCFSAPLAAMARSFARFAAAAEAGEGPMRVVSAMAEHPFAVAGTGRLCTALLETAGQRVVAKTGAEGVYGALVRGRGVGLALKVEDGGSRAAGPVLLRALELLGVLEERELDGPLASFRRPAVRNTLGDEVGRMEVELELGGPP